MRWMKSAMVGGLLLVVAGCGRSAGVPAGARPDVLPALQSSTTTEVPANTQASVQNSAMLPSDLANLAHDKAARVELAAQTVLQQCMQAAGFSYEPIPLQVLRPRALPS